MSKSRFTEAQIIEMVKEQEAGMATAEVCRKHGLSPATFYKLKAKYGGMDVSDVRRLKALEDENAKLKRLLADAIHVGRKRVELLMRTDGPVGVSRRRGTRTTIRDDRVRPASDLVDRNFYAGQPDELWGADMTYVPTWAGCFYLAVVLDAFSRRIVGWAVGTNQRTQLVLDALNMAVGQRRPSGVIHHSDQGSQYTSIAFGLRCKEAGVRPSMGSVGDAYDNARCESFFAKLECERLDRRKFQTKAEARMAIFRFIEGWYNPGRRHSALAYLSPDRLRKESPRRAGSLQPMSVHQTGGTPTPKIHRPPAPESIVSMDRRPVMH